MDLQRLLQSVKVERIEQWHVICAAATTFALCVFTYLCYRFLFRKKSAKSKKPKSQKKRAEEKKSTGNVTTTTTTTAVANSVKHVSSSPASKTLKTAPKKAVPSQPETHSKPDVEATQVLPVKAVPIPKYSNPEPNGDSSSDATDGQWIEVKKTGKKEGKTHNNLGGASAPVPDEDASVVTATKNLTTGKKKSEVVKKPSGTGAQKKPTASSRHTVYEPIEEPTFTRPAKPNRHASGPESVGPQEEEEWQEVRFSRKGRKFHNKD